MAPGRSRGAQGDARATSSQLRSSRTGTGANLGVSRSCSRIADPLLVEVDQRSEAVECSTRVTQMIGQEADAIGSQIACKLEPIAIEDPASRWHEQSVIDPIVVGKQSIAIACADLDVPQSSRYSPEQRDVGRADNQRAAAASGTRSLSCCTIRLSDHRGKLRQQPQQRWNRAAVSASSNSCGRSGNRRSQYSDAEQHAQRNRNTGDGQESEPSQRFATPVASSISSRAAALARRNTSASSPSGRPARRSNTTRKGTPMPLKQVRPICRPPDHRDQRQVRRQSGRRGVRDGHEVDRHRRPPPTALVAHAAASEQIAAPPRTASSRWPSRSGCLARGCSLGSSQRPRSNAATQSRRDRRRTAWPATMLSVEATSPTAQPEREASKQGGAPDRRPR